MKGGGRGGGGSSQRKKNVSFVFLISAQKHRL